MSSVETTAGQGASEAAGPTPVATASAFFRIAGGFWKGEKRRLAWLLTGAVGVLVVLNLLVALLINRWNKFFFDALEKKDVANVGLGVVLILILTVASAAVAVGLVQGRMRIQLNWRRWLTRRLIGRWLSDRRFYQLTVVSGEGSNPEFRIADDVRLAVDPLVDFANGLASAVLSAIAFFGVLWVVAGSIRLGPVLIPGYMVFAAILYSLISSAAMVWIGRPLIQRVEQKNAAEARFRYELTRVRESAESIALVGGDEDERDRLDETFAELARRWMLVIAKHTHMNWISNGNAILAPVVPLLLGAPKYLAGELSLGELMQIATAFTAVQVALNWLIDNAIRIAETLASAQRVVELSEALDRLDSSIGKYGEGGRIVELGFSPDDAVHVQNLSLTQQNGTVMIEGASTVIRRGEKVLVKGESGTGKSTLIRAMAGLWPWGSGRILRPRGAEIAFMPQRPYMPLGTLRHVLLYPKGEDGPVADARILAVLREVGLSHLSGRLGEEDDWDRILSGGERQRIAFARILINPPDIIIMDEATSALGEVSQAKLMGFLRTELAATTVLSVGHRPGLEEYHDREIYLVREEGTEGQQRTRYVEAPADPAPARSGLGWFWSRLIGREA